MRTSVGTAGVIVSEPDIESRGRALLLQGMEAPRSGRGGVWRRAASNLADRGVTVVRVDYPGHGDSSGADERAELVAFLQDVAAWFRETFGHGPVGAVGSCHGARLALALAARGAVDGGLLLVSPWFGATGRTGGRDLRRRVRRRLGLSAPLDPAAVADLRASSGLPLRVLVGERDGRVRATLRSAARASGATLALDVEPDLRLHAVATPAAQEAVMAWIEKWADHLVPGEPVRA